MTDALVSELRNKLSDLNTSQYDDYMLEKWLKARNYDVAKAEEMFRQSDAYKRKMNIAAIRSEYQPPEVLHKYLAGGFCGFDKDGSPVRIELYGRLDMRGIMQSCRKSDLEKTKLLECEHTQQLWMEQSQKLGKRVDGLTVIFDMKSLGAKGLWKPGLQMYLHLVSVLENNYPEMVKRMFIINAPKMFPIMWKIGRPLVSEEMKKKIHVLAADYKQHLLQYIDSDQLPAFLGGTRVPPVDAASHYLTRLCEGGAVPPHYYLSDTEAVQNMTTETVNKGEKFVYEVNVDHPGTVISWEFKTVDYDIGFSVILEEEGGKQTVLEGPNKVNSHQHIEDGSLSCDIAGKYKLIFDNTYSWNRSKCLSYVIEVHAMDAATHAEVDSASVGGKWGSMYCMTCESHNSQLNMLA